MFDRSGKRLRKSFESQSEAKSWRADQLVAIRRGKSIVVAKITLWEAAEEFLGDAEAGRATGRAGRPYAASTLRGYRQTLDDYILPELGALRLTEIHRRDIQGLADRLLGTGLSPSTVHNVVAPVQSIFHRAVKRDVVAENPARDLDLPAQTGKRVRIVPPAKAAELIQALPEGDRALWATGFYAGLRRGELRALRVSDIDLGRSEIRVERGWDEKAGPVDPKSAAGERTVPLLGILRDHLDQQLLRTGRSDEALVFGSSAIKPFATTTVSVRAKKAWKAAGLTGLTLHETRHTFASLLIDAGANPKAVQEYMGHSSIQVTFDVYGHLFPGSRDEVRERMDAYLERATESPPLAASRIPPGA